MDHAIGFPNNRHPLYPQTTLALDSKADHHDPQTLENKGTAEQDTSIFNMLLANRSGEEYLLIVVTLPASKNAGIHRVHNDLSESQTEKLRQIKSALGKRTDVTTQCSQADVR
jgi:hypothetical protein